VYDIEADGGVGRSTRHRAPHEPIDLMAAMREHSTRGRRGRSRRPSPAHTPGDDAPRHDALPIEDLVVDPADAPPPPAARGRNPVAAHLEEPTDSDEVVGGFPDDGAADDLPGDGPAVGPTTSFDGDDTEGTDDTEAAVDAPVRRPAASRKGRPSVPSWDDIVFGTRGGS
jgi:hypothetical protein